MNAGPTIPILSLPTLTTPKGLEALRQACQSPGFFELSDHGIDRAEMTTLLCEARAFFELPREVKRRVERSEANPWGYYDQELTKNTPDWKQIFDVGEPEATGPMAGALPQWPEHPASFRQTMQIHSERCTVIAEQLISAMAKSLDSPPEALAEAFEPRGTSFLRLNYYPVCATPEAPEGLRPASQGHLGINHHTDAGVLTVLMQDDVSSLQVFVDGSWITVSPQPGNLIINVGDVVQVWSNDRYRAPIHRVLANSERERFSAAFFYNPAATASYAPLASCGEPHYRPIAWSEFRQARAAGDYADQGEEVQITHYRY